MAKSWDLCTERFKVRCTLKNSENRVFLTFAGAVRISAGAETDRRMSKCSRADEERGRRPIERHKVFCRTKTQTVACVWATLLSKRTPDSAAIMTVIVVVVIRHYDGRIPLLFFFLPFCFVSSLPNNIVSHCCGSSARVKQRRMTVSQKSSAGRNTRNPHFPQRSLTAEFAPK